MSVTKCSAPRRRRQGAAVACPRRFPRNADTLWIDGVRPNLARLAKPPTPNDGYPAAMARPRAASAMAPRRLRDAAGWRRASARSTRSPFVYAVCDHVAIAVRRRPIGEFSLTKMFDRANEQERLFGLGSPACDACRNPAAFTQRKGLLASALTLRFLPFDSLRLLPCLCRLTFESEAHAWFSAFHLGAVPAYRIGALVEWRLIEGFEAARGRAAKQRDALSADPARGRLRLAFLDVLGKMGDPGRASSRSATSMRTSLRSRKFPAVRCPARCSNPNSRAERRLVLGETWSPPGPKRRCCRRWW